MNIIDRNLLKFLGGKLSTGDLVQNIQEAAKLAGDAYNERCKFANECFNIDAKGEPDSELQRIVKTADELLKIEGNPANRTDMENGRKAALRELHRRENLSKTPAPPEPAKPKTKRKRKANSKGGKKPTAATLAILEQTKANLKRNPTWPKSRAINSAIRIYKQEHPGTEDIPGEPAIRKHLLHARKVKQANPS